MLLSKHVDLCGDEIRGLIIRDLLQSIVVPHALDIRRRQASENTEGQRFHAPIVHIRDCAPCVRCSA